MAGLIIQDGNSIRKKVYHYLREKILSGSIAHNERIIETKIAKEIGTSRTPVREALHSLENERLIRSIPRVGYVVEEMSPDELEQICEIRCVIEGLAARWAMQRGYKKLIGDLKKSIENQEKEIKKDNLVRYVELDAQFHEIISKMSGSDRLLELTQNLRRHMLRYRIQCIYEKDTAKRSIEGHRRILEAIAKADIDGVGRAIRMHLEQAKADILRYVFHETHGA